MPDTTPANIIDIIEKESFPYFLKETNPVNGLIADKSGQDSPSSIAAVGFGLSVYAVAVEKGLMTREEAVARVLKILRFFYNSQQGTEVDASGYKGFYYHFLNMETGKRAWKCELSTIDTAIFIAGALHAACYFTALDENEQEIRELADKLYRRVDWRWALNGKTTITNGWKPETGFLRYRWSRGYSEAHILYILALGSPTFHIDEVCYHNWTDSFEVKELYGQQYIYAGPLFIHQLSHIWIDFRDIYDKLNSKIGISYFENSRRATLAQRQYAIHNPNNFVGYGKFNWGFTASDGPGSATRTINGKKVKFYDYSERGIPYGPDDGTISPWAVVTSLPFAPEVVLETIEHAVAEHPIQSSPGKYGFDSSFNPTFVKRKSDKSTWTSPVNFGINQGPVILMIENYQHNRVWNTMKNCNYLIDGLKKAGFSGGWLDKQ